MQNPRDCQSAFGNVYNTVASASKNFWAFAGSSASLSAFALAFAGVPQVSRHLLWRLRESHKSPGIYFGVCGSPASLPVFALAFAGVPQVSRHLLWRLRGVPQVSRHLLWRLRGVPQVSRHLLWRLRGVPQVLRRTCWPLQHAINDILNKGISFFCRTHVIAQSPLQASADCIIQSTRKRERHCENKFHSAFSITA